MFITHDNCQRLLAKYSQTFDKLSTFFEGNSRVLKEIPDEPDLLLSRMKDTVFSRKDGPVVVPGIGAVRTEIDGILARYLQFSDRLCPTSTLAVSDGITLVERHAVAPVEVVVKAAFVGSPKHVYKGMDGCRTRSGNILRSEDVHEPYVRFDWRIPYPGEDRCMPEGLADRFIDVKAATRTALCAFDHLYRFLRLFDFNLLDVCFFMNEEGTVICGEVSTDNMGIAYAGDDTALRELFARREKQVAVEKAREFLRLLVDRRYARPVLGRSS